MNGNFPLNENFVAGGLAATALTSTAWVSFVEKFNSLGSVVLTLLGIALVSLKIYNEWQKTDDHE